MRQSIRFAMDVLYWISATIACVALVLISAVIPWGVYTRYVLNAPPAGPSRRRCCWPSCSPSSGPPPATAPTCTCACCSADDAAAAGRAVDLLSELLVGALAPS